MALSSTRYYPGEKRGKGVLPPSFFAVGGFPHEVFPYVHSLNCFEKFQRRKFGFTGGDRLVGIFFQNLGKFPTRGSSHTNDHPHRNGTRATTQAFFFPLPHGNTHTPEIRLKILFFSLFFLSSISGDAINSACVVPLPPPTSYTRV